MLGVHFGFDVLSLVFLAMLAVQAIAAGLRRDRRPLGWLAVLGAACAVAGQDAFTLSLGYGTALAAARFGGGRLWPVPLAVAALLLAAFLPNGIWAPPLVLLAAAPAMGLAPGARTTPAALLAGHYLLLRYVLGVLAGEDGMWLPTLILLLGAVVAAGNAWAALAEAELPRILEAARAAETGLLLVALGLAALAKAWSQPALAGIAIAGLLLGLLAQAFLRPLLALGVETVVAGTGTASLDWLGGLLRGMPRLGGLMLFGAFGWGLLPLGPGFPFLVLLWRAADGALGLAGGGGRFGLCLLLAGLAAVWGASAAAALRFAGTGFLGRPRSLRAAAAEDAPQPVLLASGVLAGALAALALLPGVALYALRPAVALLAPAAPAVALGYAPWRLLPLLLLPAAAGFLVRRRLGGTAPTVEAPVWDGGLGKPPAWLPFGDPALQVSASAFLPVRLPGWPAPGWRAAIAAPAAGAERALALLARPAAALAVLAALLVGLLALR